MDTLSDAVQVVLSFLTKQERDKVNAEHAVSQMWEAAQELQDQLSELRPGTIEKLREQLSKAIKEKCALRDEAEKLASERDAALIRVKTLESQISKAAGS